MRFLSRRRGWDLVLEKRGWLVKDPVAPPDSREAGSASKGQVGR